MSRYSSKDNLPFLRRMHDVFLDNERRSRKESEVREKRVSQETREGGKSWEKSIRKEEARRRGIINRERAAEKRRVREEKKQAGREKIRLRDLNETVVQRERRLRRNERERTRRRKKREAEARYLELTPFREDSAIRGMVERYRIEPTTAFDVLTFLELARPRVRGLLDGLRGNMSSNIRLELICLMGKELEDGREELKEASFITGNYKLHGVDALTDEIWEQMKEKILIEFSRYQKGGSNYVLKRVQRLYIHVGKFIPFRGKGCSDPLPDFIRKKHALINMKNTDDECFKWAVTRALYPVKINSERISKKLRKQAQNLNWKNVEFPTPVKGRSIISFEQNNGVNINVFSWDETDGFHPVRISRSYSSGGATVIRLFILFYLFY
ncbi:Hypothetical predicted protein [Paramuricea clavata]|uniref:Uncharacterized protein n=1 Tax=Paramuricea clavata TaxID=317549 RepID=A0A7D9EH10_PARCT|nr:Hypothetical predicted protein [Paramuricea clavata]